MGHAKIRAPMADGHGRAYELISKALISHGNFVGKVIWLGSVHTPWRLKRSEAFIGVSWSAAYGGVRS